MFGTKLYKKVVSPYFILSVFLLYFIFLLGRGGMVYSKYREDSIIKLTLGMIRGSCPKTYQTVFESLVKAYWSTQDYLPVVLPALAGLPALMLYLEEVKSTNKKLMLIRSSRLKCQLSELLSTAVCAMMIASLAIMMFMITMRVVFPSDPTVTGYAMVYNYYMKRFPEGSETVPVYVVLKSSLVQYLRFMLYTVKCAFFLQALAVLTKSMQYSLGISFFFCYIQKRISEELVDYGFFHENQKAVKLSEIINAGFLKNAGIQGFYAERKLVAYLAEAGLILFWAFIYLWVNSRARDVSEV